MTSNVESSQVSDNSQQSASECLLQAVQSVTAGSDRPAVSDMVAALVRTEKQHKQEKTTYPVEAFVGTWRFRLSANRKARLVSGTVQGNGFYVPNWIMATLAFELSPTSTNSTESNHDGAPSNGEADSIPLTITNALQLGALRLQLTGPAKYLPRRTLIAFDFYRMTLTAFGQCLYSGGLPGRSVSTENFEQQAIAKLPFFAFIAAKDDYIAARGRGGGLALWSRE
ncbi:MAG: hypothetical protein AAFQ57_04215 [Cyanobacteria bacterium J06626_14]